MVILNWNQVLTLKRNGVINITGICNKVDDLIIFSLLNKLNFLKECNIKHLIDSLSEDEYKKAELIYCVWYLIANRYIKCDLNKDLNLNTVIWAT
ncbi:hypothetical protein D0817_20920 [Flavobacterium cupreum]|uniref:TnsA endonuclease C-terminal domain-containing protein n=2 Tax=Flavobacterium TaxID=237 RepID=A0A434A2G7_9FLAO|nr:hypothetical protein D0817_20920 [Flavobacterium cupreum]